jgi:hypothetical protein
LSLRKSLSQFVYKHYYPIAVGIFFKGYPDF